MKQIFPRLIFDKERIYSIISDDLGIKIESVEQAEMFIKEERYRRFNKLIDRKFTDNVLLKLLGYFEVRNDKKLRQLLLMRLIYQQYLNIFWELYGIKLAKGKERF